MLLNVYFVLQELSAQEFNLVWHQDPRRQYRSDINKVLGGDAIFDLHRCSLLDTETFLL